MTELERIEIEGFKGIESLAFEPSQINLITGRNNTGKTSLLEAIDLLFEPTHTGHFARNIDKLINIDFERCEIRGISDHGSKTVGFRRPKTAEVAEFFVRAGVKLLSENSLREREKSADTSTDVADRVRASVEQALTENLDEQAVTELQQDCLVLEIDGREYPLIQLGPRSGVFLNRLIKQSDTGVAGTNEANQGVTDTSIREINETDEQLFLGMFPYFQRGYVFLEEPPSIGSVTFVESARSVGDVGSDGDKDAIKIDDIGDFIREKRLVENLKTFTLDYLVFEEEDGEKRQIPYDFMGDGFKSIVGLLWELLDDEVENEVVLIEEPENHMHPGYVREVVRFLVDVTREENVQLFVTTHDNDFINDFFMENLTEGQRSYLEAEFTLLQMEEDVAQALDYETAEETLKELHLDLRGL